MKNLSKTIIAIAIIVTLVLGYVLVTQGGYLEEPNQFGSWGQKIVVNYADGSSQPLNMNSFGLAVSHNNQEIISITYQLNAKATGTGYTSVSIDYSLYSVLFTAGTNSFSKTFTGSPATIPLDSAWHTICQVTVMASEIQGALPDGSYAMVVAGQGTIKYRPDTESWLTGSIPTSISFNIVVSSSNLTVDFGHGTGFDYTPPTDSIVADAHGPYISTINTAIQFTGSATGGTPPYTWSWAFGDGGTSTIQNPTHSYANSGTYTATLTVTDGTYTGSDTSTVTISSGSGGSYNFGYEVIAPTPDYCTDIISGTLFTCISGGQLQSITTYLECWGTGLKAKCAIYSADRNTLIGVTEEKTLTANSQTWQTFNFVTKPNLVAGTSYYLVSWGNGGEDNIYNVYDSSVTGYTSISVAYPYASTFPSSLASATTYANNAYSIYGTCNN